MSEQTEIQSQPPAMRQPARLWRRVGCGILLVLWFTFVLSPCIIVSLAQQGEITIQQGELPGQQFRVWLVMEIDQRGLGISTTAPYEVNGAQCVQTDVQFALWQGEGTPISYCECYTRSDATSTWSLINSQQGICTP
jgi:hypothetical protein